MCGIFGVVGLQSPLPRGTESLVRAGTDALLHRGPDGAGYWIDDHVSFGHCRLSIIDLTTSGSQPMESPSGRYVITYNGEIYNHRELADSLMALGWYARGNSDTEVFLGAIDQWGLESTLHRVDGMFAFALFDRFSRRIHLARDRFGEKPLHYFSQGNLVWFGSEIKALETVTDFPRRLDPQALNSYFRYGYVPSPNTVYAAVRRILPATVATWDIETGRHTVETYWNPRTCASSTNEDLLALLDESVRRRTISDRPLGAFLSGGIDSSLVAALAARHVSGPLRTYTMAWEQLEYDESSQAARVSSAIGSSHTEIRLGRQDVISSIAELGRVLDEPFADSSLLASFLVSKETRRHVVVALSGDGGDELFGGYNRHRWLPRVDRLHQVPRPIRAAAARALFAASGTIERLMSPISLERRPRLVGDKVRKLARALGAGDLLSAYETTIAVDDSISGGLDIQIDLRSDLLSRDPVRTVRALRTIDLLTYLPDDILHKVDRSTMACGLESRAPFLQPDVATAALALQPFELFDDIGGKKPIREILERLIPDVSFIAPKSGFGVPVGSLLRGELRPMLEESVATFVRRGLPVDVRARDSVEQLLQGDDSPQHKLWAVLMFEIWAEHRGVSCSGI
jgi:asparagine synthase (glutamine-hydrolysing)